MKTEESLVFRRAHRGSGDGSAVFFVEAAVSRMCVHSLCWFMWRVLESIYSGLT